jgi:hypothetical protein
MNLPRIAGSVKIAGTDRLWNQLGKVLSEILAEQWKIAALKRLP